MDNEEKKEKLRVFPCWPGLNFISMCGDHCFIDKLEELWEIKEEQTFPHMKYKLLPS